MESNGCSYLAHIILTSRLTLLVETPHSEDKYCVDWRWKDTKEIESQVAPSCTLRNMPKPHCRVAIQRTHPGEIKVGFDFI